MLELVSSLDVRHYNAYEYLCVGQVDKRRGSSSKLEVKLQHRREGSRDRRR